MLKPTNGSIYRTIVVTLLSSVIVTVVGLGTFLLKADREAIKQDTAQAKILSIANDKQIGLLEQRLTQQEIALHQGLAELKKGQEDLLKELRMQRR